MNKLMYIGGFITGNRTPNGSTSSSSRAKLRECPLALWEPNIGHLGKLPFLPNVALAKVGCQVLTLPATSRRNTRGQAIHRRIGTLQYDAKYHPNS